MNSKIYKSLLNELNGNTNELSVTDLKNIIAEIDNINKVYRDLITEEDLKIIIASYGIVRVNDLIYSQEMGHEDIKIKDIEETLNLYYKYFKDKEELREYSERENYSFGNVIEVRNKINILMKKDNFNVLFNVIGTFLLIFGLIYSIVIAGIVTQSFLDFILIFGIYLLLSLFCYGIAHIISILEDIRNKLYIK